MKTSQSNNSLISDLLNQKTKISSPYYRRSSLPQDNSSYNLITIVHNTTFVNTNAVQ